MLPIQEERDLHDGTQQRLVTLGVQLRAVQAGLPLELEDLSAELNHVVAGLTTAQDELRELARGVHPAILSKSGLSPAIRSLARRSPAPVDLEVQPVGRLPQPVEVATYSAASEAGPTQPTKHANASDLNVCLELRDGTVRLVIA